MLRATLALLAAAPLALSASLQQITSNFGPNPRGVGFYIYVPDKLAANPPILVNPHSCHTSAQQAYSGSQFATLASKYGFIVIYPDSPNTADKCWDLSSKQTLTHGAGGDSQGIASMITWTINQYKADAARVFITGISSGGMMTELMAGAYPDLIAAGASLAGVPYGCYADPNGGFDTWSTACATGQVVKTGAQWASLVQSAYPGYSGNRPKMQIYHGTVDETVSYVNFGESIKLYTSLFGVSTSPVSTTPNTPQSGWTKTTYGSPVILEAYSAAGVPHNIPNQEATIMTFFDLYCSGSSCFRKPGVGSGSTSPVTTTTMVTRPASTTTAAAIVTTSAAAAPSSGSGSGGCSAAKYAQCGGQGWAGCTSCASGTTCNVLNAWYSQCL